MAGVAQGNSSAERRAEDAEMSAFDDLMPAVSSLLEGPPDPGREFSYAGTTIGEVYAMAAWFRANLPGGKKGPPVCLAAEDKAVIAAAFLASLAGGPVLLLPYAFSGQALAGLQETTGVTVAISEVARDFPPGTEVIRPKSSSSSPQLSKYTADPQKELLRLYTGGSTGVPKIWSKTGINIFAEALYLARHFSVSAKDRIVATISPYHVYGLLYSVTLPLVSGASVLSGIPSYPEEIIQSAKDCAATILVSVPAHYRVLRGKPLMGSSLRLAFSSAGVLETGDNTEFCRNNATGIIEVYGSTETGGIALRNRFRGEEQFTPYPTVDWKIHGQQLQVRSPYLSPGLTRDDGGFFTTGDRVEANGSSGFSLKGRADSITKVGGNRVDLEEISVLLKQQPGVADCLVLALAEGGGRQSRIVALIEGEDVNMEGLKKMLASRLEPYALPRTMKMVGRMPMKENGKYDRDKILRLFEQ
jgi:acyl-coenzyme A synthetase/AMP-(fatty) acid ligase